MRNSLDEIAWIEQYLLKQLNREEIKEVEQKIASDADFAQKVAFQQKLMRQVSVQAQKKELDQVHLEFLKKEGFFKRWKGNRGKSSGLLNLLMVFGGLSIVLLSGYWFLSDGDDTVNLFNSRSEINVHSDLYKTDSTNLHVAINLKDSLLSKDNLDIHDRNIEQYFLIDNEDTSIQAKQGTIVSFANNSFVFKDSKKTYQGKVQIMLKEYYDLTEMLWASLTTMSDGHMLETGGMLYVEAIDTTGNFLSLIKQIGIKIPTRNKKQEMQLFLGENTSGIINWKLASSSKSSSLSSPFDKSTSSNKLLNKSTLSKEPSNKSSVKAFRWIDMLEQNKYRVTYKIEKHQEFKAAYIYDLIPDGFHFQLCDSSLKSIISGDSIFFALKKIPYDSVAYYSYIIKRNNLSLSFEPQFKSRCRFIYKNEKLIEIQQDVAQIASDKIALERSFKKKVNFYSTFDDKYNYKELCDEKKLLENVNQKASCKDFSILWNTDMSTQGDQGIFKSKITKFDGSVTFDIDINTGKAINQEIHYNNLFDKKNESITIVEMYIQELIKKSEFTPQINNGFVYEQSYRFIFNVEIKNNNIIKIKTAKPRRMDLTNFSEKEKRFQKIKNERLNKVLQDIKAIEFVTPNKQICTGGSFLDEYYTLASNYLGWINCDRFINLPLVTIELPKKSNAMSSLVCHSLCSVLTKEYSTKSIVGYKVPKDEKVTLIQQVFNTDMTISFSFQTFHVSEADNLPEPVFEQMTYEAFAKKVEEIKKQSQAW